MRVVELGLVCAALASAAGSAWEGREIATGLKGGYQVVIADINADHRPDLLVVASGMHELVWFENPTWARHVIAGGFDEMINAAVVPAPDGGVPTIVLAHGFSMRADRSPGIVSVAEHVGDAREPWRVREIDRLPTSHRLRVATFDGVHRVVVNAPLSGARAVAPDYRDHVPIVYYEPGEWQRRLIGDETQGVLHGVFVDGDALLTASFEGIHSYRMKGGKWSRTRITAGDPAAWPKSGSSDVTVVKLGSKRLLAAIEPWHGHQVVVYQGARRRVIDDSLADTHSIVAADLDGDRKEELIVAQRGKPYRVLVYRNRGSRWERIVVDEGGVSAAACAAGDLDGDRRPEIVCVGSATANLKIYRLQSKMLATAMRAE